MPQFWDLGLKTGIWASRLGYGPQNWDLSLEAGIWASRQQYGPGYGGIGGTKKKEKEEEGKIPDSVKA